MEPRKIPNMSEMSDADVWKIAELSKEEATWHSDVKRAAHDVLSERMGERGATRAEVDGGEVVQSASVTYAYDTTYVDGEFVTLIGPERFDQALSDGDIVRAYKIKRPFLKKLMQLGDEHRRVIDEMTTVNEGRPSLKGPKVVVDGDGEVVAVVQPLDQMYEQSGGDTSVCEFCGKPLDDATPWTRGRDGAGAHNDCIPGHKSEGESDNG